MLGRQNLTGESCLKVSKTFPTDGLLGMAVENRFQHLNMHMCGYPRSRMLLAQSGKLSEQFLHLQRPSSELTSQDRKQSYWQRREVWHHPQGIWR
jgi:hypothetical protein